MNLRLEKCPKCNSQWNVHPGAINYCTHMDACPMLKIMEEKMETSDLLVERKKTHGDFAANAAISQTIKIGLRCRDGWEDLTAVQKESIEMICLKLSRIMSGQSNHKDHWDDIAGYAKLAADRCPQ